MLHKLSFIASIGTTALLLTGCASHTVVNPSFTVPKTGKTGAFAVSVVCKATPHSTASKVFGLEPFDSSATLQYDQTKADFWHSQGGTLEVRCDGKPHHYLEHTTAGSYHIDAFIISNSTVDLNLKFSIIPNKVTYIGRVMIDARSVTQNGGSEYVTFIIYDKSKSDLNYFRHYFRKIPTRDYRIHLMSSSK